MALLGAQFVSAVSPNPVGSLQAYAGASAPTGWLLCDGGQTLITAYPELYSVLGTTYGSLTNGSGGAGSTHFRVPDLRGRVPIGAGTGAGQGASGSGAPSGTALTARTRGGFGGDERLQTHTHTQDAHGHTLGGGQSFGTNFGPNAGGVATFGLSVAIVNTNTYQGPYSAQNTTATNQNAGSGSSENMPPFLVTNYIIRAISETPRSGIAYGSTPPIVTALPANPQFGEEVSLVSGGILLHRQWNGSQWVTVGSGARQVLNAYSVVTPAERQDIMSNAWVNITGLEIAVTPVSTSSRFILEANIHHSGTYVSSFSFSRNGTVITSHSNLNENGSIATSYWNNAVDNAYMISTPLGYVDAPATTSQVTYRVVGTSSWNGETNRVMRINDRGTDMRSISNFSIWEVAS
jgi:microcystin-dependent protein